MVSVDKSYVNLLSMSVKLNEELLSLFFVSKVYYFGIFNAVSDDIDDDMNGL